MLDRRKTDRNPTQSFRFILAVGSLIWGVLMVLPLFPIDSLELRAASHEWIVSIFPAPLLIFLFLLHGVVGVTVCLQNLKNRVFVFLDSVLGSLLWTITTSLSIEYYLSAGLYIPPIFSGQILLSVISLIALIRTPYGR